MIILLQELYTRRPLFPGSSEIDQIYKICSVLGTPSHQDWAQGHQLASNMSFKFPQFSSTHLSSILGPRVGARAISLLYSVISWNPGWRSSAQETLKHSYFRQQTSPSKPGSASSNNLNLALKPSRLPRRSEVTNNNPESGNNNGARATVAVSQVEPVYGRELLRNYKEDVDKNKEKDEDLKQLLESLKSSDVVPVKHKKVNKNVVNNAATVDTAETYKYNHKVSLLDSDEPNNLSGERRYSKSPPKFKTTFSTSGKLPLTQKHSGSFAPPPYIPSFGNKAESLSNGPIVARRLFRAERDKPRDVTRDIRDNNHNQHNKPERLIKQSSTDSANNNNDFKPLGNGFLKKSTFGTQETLSNLSSSKADFSNRVLDTFSDFHLGDSVHRSPRMMNKVRSLPELKSEALLVGAKKAIHDRGGYGAYVPSQLESPKSKLQVRTDWKAKYLK